MNAAHTQELGSSAPLRGEHVETLWPQGELGVRELEALGEQLLARLRRGVRFFVVDLAEVTHLDYRGVPPLLARVKRVREAGGDVKLCALSPYLEAILRVAGVHDAGLERYAEVGEAHAAFAHSRLV